MMNRGVMNRQMFKKGGAAGFPDVSGDGKITQKDILKGRGVFAGGGKMKKGYAAGGVMGGMTLANIRAAAKAKGYKLVKG